MKKNKNKFWRYSKVASEIDSISKKVKDIKQQSVKLWAKIDTMKHKETNSIRKDALGELQRCLYSQIIDSLRGSSLQLDSINDNIMERLNDKETKEGRRK
jgi:septation ring formation regulator EzrA